MGESPIDLLRLAARKLWVRLAQGWGNDDAVRLLRGVHEIEGAGRRWRSLGEDPQMDVPIRELGLGPGWWMMELRISTHASSQLAKLYVDLGDGMSDQEAIRLPYHSRRTIKRLVRFPRVPLALRFDPLESEGVFALEWMRFVPVTTAFARDRMQRRVDHFLPTVEAGVDLVDAYSRTFDLDDAQPSYLAWIDREETPAWERLDADAAALIEQFERRPLISVVLPTYETDAELLRICIESVRAQSYPHWELCIADDASSSAHIRPLLDEFAAKDERIRIHHRDVNGHISAATNTALRMARGEYVAFLDHDDALARHALFAVVRELMANPAAEVVYSDEDKIDEVGDRHQPHFKSGWNPDLLLAQNYICHLVVIRRQRVLDAGALREGFEGSQDHDLLLRVTRDLALDQVVHIPKVLYHWRVVEGSTAASADAKSYAWDAGLRAVRDAARDRAGESATVEAGRLPHTYRVHWAIPRPTPRVTLIVPTRDGLEILSACVKSILDKTRYDNFELVIVDNQSVEEETLEYLQRIQTDARVRVLGYDAPFNFSAINNFAVRETRGDVVVLVNNDIEVIDGDWLTELVSQALRDEIGCVGAKLHYTDGTIQHGGVILGIGGVAGHAHKYFPEGHSGYFGRLNLIQNMSAVTAACLAVRRSVYEEVGGLDEDNLRVAFNDVDFCLKVRARGYRNLFTPFARLYHHESVSRGDDNHPDRIVRFHAERDYMIATWGSALGEDPYYNPNLSLTREDFSLR